MDDSGAVAEQFAAAERTTPAIPNCAILHRRDGMKVNCWEFKKCGRQTGGSEAGQLGVCPAAVEDSYNGINGGMNAGRYCWRVAGTYCGGEVTGIWAQRILTCLKCDFYALVKSEESGRFTI
jgi:hypothetical protein